LIGRLGALAPRLALVQKEFEAQLEQSGACSLVRRAMLAITPGAAGLAFSEGGTVATFEEEIGYQGRRLAKLGLTPARVRQLLACYDSLLAKHLPAAKSRKKATHEALQNLRMLVSHNLDRAFHKVREAESAAISDLFRGELESSSSAEVAGRCLEVLCAYTRASAGRAWLLDGARRAWTLVGNYPTPRVSDIEILHKTSTISSGKTTAAYRKAHCYLKAAKSGSAWLDPGWARKQRTVWRIPLFSHGALLGAFEFGFDRQCPWLPRELEVLQGAAKLCAMAVERADLLEELATREREVRRLAERMVEIEEAERRRLCRELHDESGQSMLCLRLQLEMLERAIGPEGNPWRERLAGLRDYTDKSLEEIRRVIAALSPAVLEEKGLAAGIRQLLTRFRQMQTATVYEHVPSRLDLPNPMQVVVYRLVQEALNNIAKYAQATTVKLSVEIADGALRVHVEDDGVGFGSTSVQSSLEHFGLAGMKERVSLFGGKLSITSVPRAEAVAGSAGTTIRIELPLPEEASSAA
jgi:signal transduction histidine kinase